MKRVITLTVLALFLCSVPAFASHLAKADHGHEGDSSKALDDWGLNAKADAPNLVRFNEDWTLGAEVTKDVYRTSADEGWAAFAKITYTGSLLDFSNSGE